MLIIADSLFGLKLTNVKRKYSIILNRSGIKKTIETFFEINRSKIKTNKLKTKVFWLKQLYTPNKIPQVKSNPRQLHTPNKIPRQ